ncbi:MAG: hypothetical protein JSV99_11310 [Planctomycetota bacterium]|nr:MAG: hypothetical protein JSV99_11310 [Planctomycetota bacterium]
MQTKVCLCGKKSFVANQKMSNKTNFRMEKININLGLTKDYENGRPVGHEKTKPILPALAAQLRPRIRLAFPDR